MRSEDIFLQKLADSNDLVCEVFDIKEEARLSFIHSGDRDSFRFYRRAARIAAWLIDDTGELQVERLSMLLESIKKTPHIFYPNGALEIAFGNNLLRVVQLLHEKPSFWRQIKKFSLPLCHKGAEKLVLNATGEKKLTTSTVRRAVLSGCIILLRQNVGSCFATAPAILIHEEQTDCFLKDLYELLSQGSLKRVCAGVQHTASLSSYEGEGGHPLVKAWEFTLASFSEAHKEFSRWNLYIALGLDVHVVGGVGEAIFQCLEEMLEESNAQVENYQKEYVFSWDRVKSSEALMRRAQTESEARRLYAEHQSHVYHLHMSQEMRDNAHVLAGHYASFFPFIMEQLNGFFAENFQEMYDPEMKGSFLGPYDDSPAGFRLVYKYGRHDPSAWSFIRSQDEYVRALEHFFRSQEHSLIHMCNWKGSKPCIEKIITRILHLIAAPGFIEEAKERIQKAHEKVFSKEALATPWAYLSGGTMEILLRVYYRHEKKLTEESAYIESPMDLLVFILETLKNLSPENMAPFLKNPDKRMLMCSPTHAFSFFPGWDPWLSGWQEQKFTYTWVRDFIVGPRKKYYEALELSKEDQDVLLRTFFEGIEGYPISFSLSGKKSPRQLSLFVQEKIPELKEHFDAFLYEALPVVDGTTAHQRFQSAYENHVSLHGILGNTDIYTQIARQIYPFSPLLFADTNWAYYYFGFVVNPGTGEFELWRMNRLGTRGFPMSSWKKHLDGSEYSIWRIYTRIQEYL